MDNICLYCNNLLTNKQIKLKRKYCSRTCYHNDFKNIFIKKYGVDNPSKVSNVNQNRKKYYIKKYGVDNPSKNNNIIIKIKRHHLDYFYENILLKYLKENNLKALFKKEEYLGTKKDKIKGIPYYYQFFCKSCSHKFTTYITDGKKPICPICNDTCNSSKGEKEVLEFIKTIFNKLIEIRNQNLLKGKLELDIYLPELKLAIEYNGHYWHKLREKQYPGYHKLKAKLCKEKGIKLINICDKQWLKNKNLCKEKIKKYIIN